MAKKEAANAPGDDDRRKSDRREQDEPFDGSDRRISARRTGIDRRKQPRS